MPKRTNRVEVIMPNGTTRMVSESLIQDITKHFGAVLASDKTFRNTPKELLSPPKKVIVPVLDEIRPKIEPIPEKVPVEYPGDNVSSTAPIEAVTTQPVPDEPIKEPGPEPVKKVVRKTVKRKK